MLPKRYFTQFSQGFTTCNIMFRFVLLFLSVIRLTLSENYPKCCPGGAIFSENRQNYECRESHATTASRIQIVDNDFEREKSQKFCVDVENGNKSVISLFKKNSGFTKVQDLGVALFPKCCPLNYSYDSITHGCAENKKFQKFFNESFVKIGLPHCRIIRDIKLETAGRSGDNEAFDIGEYNKMYGEGSFCLDRDTNDTFILRECTQEYNICSIMKCIHKCCPDGQSFINGSKCYDTYTFGLNFSTLSTDMDDINEEFAIIHGSSPSVYVLSPGRFNFHLDEKGVFMMREVDNTFAKINVTRRYPVEEDVYCIEHAIKFKPPLNKFLFFRAFDKTGVTKFLFTGVAMAISCIFLALTILYYSFSDEKRTVFGKTLISYCCAAFLGFLILAYLAFVKRPNTIICTIIMYVILYATLSMFTWMNAMCIDIYCTFGSSKSFSTRHQKSREWKRFLVYSIYGWGAPLALVALSFILDHLGVLPEYARLIVDEERCYIYVKNQHYGQLFFSTIPTAVFLIINLYLFVKTSMYCLKVKKEINRMNDTNALKGEKSQKFANLKDRLGLLMKLFLIMGISFLFEAVSAVYDFKKSNATAVVEVIWDTFNSLQGFFIFLIFIFKKRIFKKCQKHLGIQKLRKISLVPSGITQTTSLPNLSNKL